MNNLSKMIPGLRYIPNYLSQSEQENLLEWIDNQPWLDDLKRRVQEYGFHHEMHRKDNDASYLGPLPEQLFPLALRVYRDGLIEAVPDQVVIHETMPGQGITAQIDCRTCYGESTLSVSMGSPCVMIFTHTKDKREVPVLLAPGSLLAMHGEARRDWKRGIRARRVDHHGGDDFPRGRRVALTFREVVA